MSASLETTSTPSALVVHLGGEIDLANADVLEAQIGAMLGDVPGLIVDLTGITYFDSTGMRMLDGLVGACDGAAMPIRVVAPEAGAARFILRMCAWRRDLLSSDLEQALTALARAGA